MRKKQDKPTLSEATIAANITIDEVQAKLGSAAAALIAEGRYKLAEALLDATMRLDYARKELLGDE